MTNEEYTMSDETIFNLVSQNQDDNEFLENLTIECAIANKVNAIRFVLEKASHVSNIRSAIVNAASSEIVDVALSVIGNNVPRSLNACLHEIKDLSILRHLLTHRYSKFLVGYRQYECVRLAVLDGDIARVNLFLQHVHVDVHSSGTNTMDKTCVEIACMFNYDMILELFMCYNINCLNDNYSDKVTSHVIRVQCDYQRKRENAMHELLQAYIKNRMSVPHHFINNSDIMSRIVSSYKTADRFQRETNSLVDRLQYV